MLNQKVNLVGAQNTVNKLSISDLFEKALKQEKLSLDFGFHWENIKQTLDQIRSECDEVQEAWTGGNSNHLQEEIGDIIHATISLAFFCNVDFFEALKRSVDKYQKRFEQLVSLVQSDKLENLKGQPIETLISYWEKAKNTAE